MTTFQAALLHLMSGLAAVAAAVALALTGHIDGTVALAIVVAALGISGTGLAGAVAISSPAKTQSSTASPPSVTRTPSSTT